MNSRQLQLYITAEQPCPYLPDRSSRSLFIDPAATLSTADYAVLIDRGFRRSGNNVYRPECSDYSCCIPIRLPVAQFSPRRSQRRTARKWQDVEVRISEPQLVAEQFELYSKYAAQRHPDGSMASLGSTGYMEFLAGSWCDTHFVEFRLHGTLQAVAIIDFLPQGLSAVYTFFDPNISHLSPGVFSVLWQIEEARRQNLPWLYLGYWVPGCRKMSYKDQYQPLQIYRQDTWQTVDPALPFASNCH